MQAHAYFALLAMNKVTECTDMGAHSAGAAERELHHTEGGLLRDGPPGLECDTSPVSDVCVLSQQ